MKNPRHAFNVEHTFEIKGRGLVITANKRSEDLPYWLALEIGDEIEIRLDEDLILNTTITGIERTNPWNPRRRFGFMIPPDITTTQIASGCEVWVGESSMRTTEDKPN